MDAADGNVIPSKAIMKPTPGQLRDDDGGCCGIGTVNSPGGEYEEIRLIELTPLISIVKKPTNGRAK
jgi:hypothetical protein